MIALMNILVVKVGRDQAEAVLNEVLTFYAA